MVHHARCHLPGTSVTKERTDEKYDVKRVRGQMHDSLIAIVLMGLAALINIAIFEEYAIV